MKIGSTNGESTYEYSDALIASLEYFRGDELAARAFLDKYALRNFDNELLEATPDQMHRRMAREFARIEKRKFKNPLTEDEIFGYFDHFRFIVPQGSPMYAVGNPHQIISASNCFVAGTRVFTANGVKDIESVEVGDSVITHTGHLRKVQQTHRNEINNRPLFDIKCFRTPEFSVTGNHRFWSISQEQMQFGDKPQWNEIQYLRVGDYVAIPKMVGERKSDFDKIDIGEVFSGDELEYGDRLYSIGRSADTVSLTTLYEAKREDCVMQMHRTHAAINRHWSLDEDFAYFLGLWYGDGCVFGSNWKSGMPNPRDRKSTTCTVVRGITFTFNSKEKHFVKFVSEYGEKLFGIKPDINTNNEETDHTIQVAFHSGLIGMVFEQLFGRKFDGKKLNIGIFGWDYLRVSKLINGLLDSDGTITQDGSIRLCLSNHGLIESIYFLMRINGEPVGISRSARSARLDFPKNSKYIRDSMKSYDDDRIDLASSRAESKFHLIEIDGTTFVRIDEKGRNYSKPQYAYTLGVENDHSYCVEGVICENCFVLDSPMDSYSGICKTDQELVQISKRRGGVGIDVSNIRPVGSLTKNAARTSTGLIPFMERFSNSIREVGQAGRRGALMQSVSIHHPESVSPLIGDSKPIVVKNKNENDIHTTTEFYDPSNIDFATIKYDRSRVTGANISIRLTDEFLQSVEDGTDFEQRWPVDSKNPIISRMTDARKAWKKIVRSAWQMAEPGLLFWDNIIRESPADCYARFGFMTLSTNPCGEIPLSRADSCRLLAINLFNFVRNAFTKKAFFDYAAFFKCAQVAQRLMDDLIDLEEECILRILDKIDRDPEPKMVKEVEKNLWLDVLRACRDGRRTGTGITALGDTLAALGIPYSNEDGIAEVTSIYRTLKFGAYRSSVDMAEELGHFPVWDHDLEKQCPFFTRFRDEKINLGDSIVQGEDIWQDMKKFGRRNIAILTTAPTGTVSLMTQTSSGIEPQFDIAPYTRRKKGNPGDNDFRSDVVDQNGDHWMEFKVYPHKVQQWMDVTGETDIKKSPWWGSCANQIDWPNRVKLQAAAQKHVCHSLSSTLNLPADVSVEVVDEIYRTAWKSGCKGITVYRDGCRSGVLIRDKENEEGRIPKTDAPKRPKTLPADVHHIRVKGVEYFVLVGKMGNEPYEIFAGKNGFISKDTETAEVTKIKRGYYSAVFNDGTIVDDLNQHITDEEAGITRLLSLSLRHGSDIKHAVAVLERVPGDMQNFARCIARALKKHIADGVVATGMSCPSCASDSIVHSEGCKVCKSCGWSGCS